MNLGMEDSQSKILDIKNNKNNLNKDKIKNILKIALMIGILIIVLKEFLGIISSFDISKFERYTKELSLLNIICIAFLGIISYIPLSFYDFVLKKRVNIELNNKKLYKFSWIASSVASIAGFGGSTALALKTYFYNDYVKDKKLLIKEISKIIALNLSGFSMVCLVYIMMNTKTIQLNNPKVIGIILISMYLPALIAYLAYKYLTGSLDEKIDAKDAIKIILISASEWLTTIILIYSILVILGIKISIAQFFPIFVISIVVAIVSMSPGGIGSFDLSFMLGLQALGVEGEKILLAIFLYRVSYYLLPLSIGAILYANEIYLKMDNKIRTIATNVVSKVSYFVLVGLVFFSGASLLINGLIPNLNDNIKIIRETSYLLMMNRLDSLYFDQIAIILGFGLIATSRLIMYKSKKIYNITTVLVIMFGVIAIMNHVGYLAVIYVISIASILCLSKPQFYREGFVMKWEKFLRDILVLGVFEIMYMYVLRTNKYWLYSPYSHSIFIYSMIGFTMAVAYIAIMYLGSKSENFPKLTLKHCEGDLKNILEKYQGSNMIHYIYLDDKFIYLNEDKDVIMQYQICLDKIFILGSPVGNPDKILDVVQEFSELADKYGYTPVFCSVEQSLIPQLHEIGYDFMKLGEEASVDLQEFTLEGRKMKSVRNAISRVTKQEYTFEIVKPPFTDEFLNSLKSVSDEWLGNRKEKGFSIGSFKVDYLSREPIAIVKNKEGEIKGFANLMPMYDEETLSIDLMRFSNSTCNGVMDFMFVNLFIWAKEEGYLKFNMGLAPLAEVGKSTQSRKIEKLGGYVYSCGEKIYSFQGLRKFKEKYCDDWNGVYIAYKKKSSIAITIAQALILISK